MGRRRDRPWRVALEGPSGAGKSTLVPLLARELHGRPVAEAYERLGRPGLAPRGPKALLRLELRLLEEDARRFGEADGTAPSVYDTGFLGPVTYLAAWSTWDPRKLPVLERLVDRAATRLVEGRWGLPDLSVYLRVPPGEVARRLRADPKGHPGALRARHARAAALEEGWWTGAIARALPGRVRVVDGVGEPEVVARRVRRLLGTVRRRPPPEPADALRALGLLRRAAPGARRAGARARVKSRGRSPRPPPR